MVLLLLALAAGPAVGYARRGQLRRLAASPPIRNRLVLTALGSYVCGVLGGLAWEPLLPTMSALCWVTLGFYTWLNRRHRGALLLTFGLAANGLVILLNGAMPVSLDAELRAGSDQSSRLTAQTTEIDDGTIVPWLGKAVPVAFPPRPEVVSPGDVAIAAGCAVVLATGMTAPTSKRNASSNTAAEPEQAHGIMGAEATAETDPVSPRTGG